MKKKTVICFILIAAVLALASCGQDPAWPKKTPEGNISVYCPYDIAAPVIEKFLELHPDFRYTFDVPYEFGTSYNPLEYTIVDEDAPDIYFVGSQGAMDVEKYTQGDMSGYALPYQELGIDLDAKIEAAGTLQYIVDTGTRPSDGKVVGLAYQSRACAFIYCRSIAKEIWGTDDPAVIAAKIGPGWDKFFEAAEELKGKGYYITAAGNITTGKGSSFDGGSIWHSAQSHPGKSWIKDGKLYIDPERETFFDLYKELVGKEYSPGWYDMTKPEKPVFGLFMPAWRVNYGFELDQSRENGAWGDWAACDPPVGFFSNFGYWVIANKELENDPGKKAAVAEFIEWMTLDCTEKGLQYYLANGKISYQNGIKDTVASGTVMEMLDCKMDILGGQDMFDIFTQAGQLINVGNKTEYDAAIDEIWFKYFDKVSGGECAPDEALASFKQEVKEKLGIDAWN